MTTAAANRESARALLSELERAGVSHVCVSPGSRSTALVVAAAASPTLRTWVVNDERSCGYFAIGLARATHDPVAVICTSGTAAANLAPAVAEAFFGRVPLIVLTADRPPEVRAFGAAQTIVQPSVFGGHVRWGQDLLVPGPATSGLIDYYRAVACRAVATATASPNGPVHLNVPFREPLIDDDDLGQVGEATGGAGEASAPDPTGAGIAVVVRSSETTRTETEPSPVDDVVPSLPGEGPIDSLTGHAAGPRVRMSIGASVLSGAMLDEAAEFFATGARGVIVCGHRAAEDQEEAAAIAELGERLGWPILADPLSGIRFGTHSLEAVIDSYDLLLRASQFTNAHQPDRIVRIGGLPVSNPLLDLLEHSRAAQILIAPPREWPDPFFRATRVVWADVAPVCRALAQRAKRSPSSQWLASWRRESGRVRAVLDSEVRESDGLFGGRVAYELAGRVEGRGVLWLGNSMPVRDVDTFVGCRRTETVMMGNRGGSGIDGVMSSALGAAAAGRQTVSLLVGDLSFLHDIGGLQIGARYDLDLLVVIVNNDGGGIFSFLPQAGLGDLFERYFVTPHGLDLKPAVEMCRGRYWRVEDRSTLEGVLDEAMAGCGLRVVDVRVSRDHERKLRQSAVENAVAALAVDAEARS